MDNESTHDVIINDTIIAGEIVSIVRRSYLSTQHLYAARYAADEAAEQERQLTSRTATNGMRLRCATLCAIVESVAFLEAAANELYQNVADDHLTPPAGDLDPACRQSMRAVWRATKEGYFDVLEKYQLILQLSGKETFDRGANPYQNAALLIQLRNYVVHFKPEGVDSKDSLKITKRLEGRFRPNAARTSFDGAWSDQDIFGAGCAEWCWRSARSLTDEFARRLTLTLDYHIPRPTDPLPD